MNRIVGIFLFTLFGFLIWLYLASNHSTIDDWWSVKSIKEVALENKDITIIPPPTYATSTLKVLIGLSVFILLGTLLSLIVVKGKHSEN